LAKYLESLSIQREEMERMFMGTSWEKAFFVPQMCLLRLSALT